MERLTTQISVNTSQIERGLQKGNPLHYSLLKSKKEFENVLNISLNLICRKIKGVTNTPAIHHDYIAGYSIKNDLFVNPGLSTTPKNEIYSNNNLYGSGKSPYTSQYRETIIEQNNAKTYYSTERNETFEKERYGEMYYDSGSRNNFSYQNDPKKSTIIYRYQEGGKT